LALRGKAMFEDILKKVVFYKVRDAECGVEGWRYEEEYFGLTTGCLRTFDTLADALRDYLESLEEK
jgi:hypothetical protein